MSHELTQPHERDVPAVQENLYAGIRAQMDEAFHRMQELEAHIVENPLIQGFSVFPHGDRLQLRPFGHVLDETSLEAGWREPFLHYELKDDQLQVKAEVPGVRRKDIKLDVGPSFLRLEADGEGCRYKAFLEPGMSLDPDNVKAECKAGILSLQIPLKPTTARRVRHIKVD